MGMKLDKQTKFKLMRTTQIVLAIVVIIDLVAHVKSGAKPPQVPIPTVKVQKPALIPVVEYVMQTGNTVAFNSVNLVARVEGFLDDISFVDGTFIKKDKPLFVIEPEPYMAKLREAQASLDAQKAIHAYDVAEYARQQRMYKENATSLNNVEKWLAKSEESKAEVDKAKADVDIAEINASYTHIAAPFDGRIGRHLVDKGNLVGNGVATNLATIDQIDPIYVYFNLNELDLIKLRKAAHDHGYDAKKLKQIPVAVSLQNGSGFNFEGKLDFINTGLNSSTGTMEFRALMPNKEKILVPGLFVQVRVAITEPTPTLTVPDTAVLYDQIGSYVLLVDKNNLVVLKRVVTGSLEKGMRAIVSGLTAQDNVIVNGLQFATPGNPVTPEVETVATKKVGA